MECYMEARALKSSLHGEVLSMTEQLLLDDILCATATISAVSSDDFSVDDLLDFSSAQFEDGSVEEEDEKDFLSVSSQERGDNDDNNSNSSGLSSDQSLFTYELVEPVDDLVELEWVSRFVDDSSRSEPSLLYPAYAENRFEPEEKPVLNQPLCFPSQIPSKARTKVTKRPRPTSRVWSSLGSPSSLTESPQTESPVSSSSSSGSVSTPCVLVTDTVQTFDWINSFTEPESEPEVKKAKKKPEIETGGGLFQRRCSHCQTQKTPQWRTGPLGPKTLCNACGVRYKSGRLFPEYRPACSPTFSGDIHSNSHRKVLEMRKKKEMGGPEVGLTQMVQSF